MTAISLPRELVYDLVAGGVDEHVYRWLPGSADDVPCYVVGRPYSREGDSRAMLVVVVPVYALGRTLRDDEAQAELDAMGDRLHELLWKPPQTPHTSLRLERCDATVVPVAGVEIPAYTAQVVTTTAYC